RAFEGQGPLALVVTPEPIEGGEAGVTTLLEASRATPVAAPAEQAALDWPYADFGAVATPASTTEVAAVGATVVTFPSGVRLTVKPTTFTDQQILASARTGSGEMGLPTGRFTAQSLAPRVFTAAGLGKLTADELNRVLTGKIYGAGFSIDSDAYQLS